jgi:hypothetical protein
LKRTGTWCWMWWDFGLLPKLLMGSKMQESDSHFLRVKIRSKRQNSLIWMNAPSDRLGHLIAWRRIFLDKPLVVQLHKNVFTFSETCRLIPCSQGLFSRPSLETEEPNLHSHTVFHKPRSVLLLTSHLHLGFSQTVFPPIPAAARSKE